MNRLNFASDYTKGAHPAILKRLAEVNDTAFPGYGLDAVSASAAQKIRAACGAPEADVFFLTGGTQTNATVIDALLLSYQGVIAADTGHITVHEAGAIERDGHKVLALPHTEGKLSAEEIEACIEAYEADDNHDHMVMPGMVYLSQPTEFGTLYTLRELKAISGVCRKHRIPLYVDGARLAYALATSVNDVSLTDLAALTDVFYIGGTKCGALLGEAVVFPVKNMVPHFFTIMKQHGALLAKGFVPGAQFDTLFTDDLYLHIGTSAIRAADRIRTALSEKGYRFAFRTPTNQIFVILDDRQKARLTEQVDLSFWEKISETETVIRIATSWSTTDEDVDRLVSLL